MKKQYTIFKVGDVVEVIPSEKSFWVSILNHIETSFTVAEVYESGCIYCAGHPQQLRMTDGTVASGSWFDFHTPDNKKIEPFGCTSGGYMGEGQWSSPAPHHQGREDGYDLWDDVLEPGEDE